MVDAPDSKSGGARAPCRFEPDLRYCMFRGFSVLSGQGAKKSNTSLRACQHFSNSACHPRGLESVAAARKAVARTRLGRRKKRRAPGVDPGAFRLSWLACASLEDGGFAGREVDLVGRVGDAVIARAGTTRDEVVAHGAVYTVAAVACRRSRGRRR